jgi:TolB-like protein/DNA-binding winged helix-turn-helix (wHTH) protein
MGFVHKRVCFAAFEVDLHTRELRKYGVRVKLEDQPFEILSALLEKPGELVTRGELQARIWPDGTFVDFEKSLNKAVSKLRLALGDSAATPRFVETLSGRGYRLIVPVDAPDAVRVVEPVPPAEPPAAPGAEPAPSPAHVAAALPPAAPRRPRSKRAWVLAASPVLIGLLTAAVVLGTGRFSEWVRLARGIHPLESLVVLPFQNLSGDPSQEYYADGLTDELIGRLARIGSVRVISRTSAMRYKGAQKTVPEIARELDVDGVIEGSVLRSGDRVRVNVKLVRAAAERQLWAEEYEGSAGEASRLQARIAVEVAHQISGRLTAETRSLVAASASISASAYEKYLRGRYIFNLRGSGAIGEAARYFELATKEEPRFALAWSGLADSYGIGTGGLQVQPELSREYALKAVALDPNLAEAHISLGLSHMNECRFAEAEKSLKQGIQLSPGYVTGHQFYAICLLATGRVDKALDESDRALQLDPFSWPVNNMRGYILTSLRRYDQAIEQFGVVLQINPGSATAHEAIARIHWLEGRYPEALAAERRVAQVSGSEVLTRGLAEVEAAYARSGFRAALLKNVGVKERASRSIRTGGFVGYPLMVTLLYGALEDRGKVLALLEERLEKQRQYDMTMLLKSAPEWDFLRSDPEFQRLLQKAGLEP